MTTIAQTSITQNQLTVYHHSLYWFELSDDQRILTFRWTTQTSTMNYEDFQEACSNYAGFAIEHGALDWLRAD